jgi:hypothetical protein
MKLQSNNLLESLSIKDVKNLTLIVKETFSKEFKRECCKNFTAAELWNIHRQRKSFITRRQFI